MQKIFWLVVFEAIGIANSAHAGAWVQEKGASEFIYSTSFQSGSSGFDANGNPSLNIDFQKWETAVFGEYGFAKNWSVVGRLAYQDVSIAENGFIDQRAGFGASKLAIKRNLAKRKNLVFSMQGEVSIPGGAENGLDLRLGEGNIEWEVRALAGFSWEVAEKPGFFDVQLARKFRAKRIPDEWMVDITAGVRPSNQLMVMGQMFALQSDTANFAGTRKLSSLKLQGSLVWFFNRRKGVQVFVSKTIDGRNIVADTAIGIGWWSRF
ncbi:hypothetical protein MNBD_ALPHA06-567 [hydrothermal vent metagenome]|uniref:Uncharacterized protein n=1 Tax=hydrothermal vent metagenome TaxID=652676 RepID=A0A3B0SD41_9ZZZZ